MPIRPENRARYPKEWPQIRERIRQRSGDRCECAGECGSDHNGRCNVLNGLHGARNPDGEFVSWEVLGFDDARRWKHVKIVLTVAHLDHTPENCDDSNLKHMCQRCHLRYDAKHHAETARETRRKKLQNHELNLETIR